MAASGKYAKIPKQKYPRHSLIDLAYGALTMCRSTLMKCESEREFRDVIIGTLEALYDSSTMIEITYQAEKDLWESFATAKAGFSQMHLRDYSANAHLYRTYMEQFRIQNHALRALVQAQLAQTDATASG